PTAPFLPVLGQVPRFTKASQVPQQPLVPSPKALKAKPNSEQLPSPAELSAQSESEAQSSPAQLIPPDVEHSSSAITSRIGPHSLSLARLLPGLQLRPV
ncbi:hypothetical protein FALBO_16793, partial [Fusarium albosuccineum]